VRLHCWELLDQRKLDGMATIGLVIGSVQLIAALTSPELPV
jgi:hypothetical protein